MTHQRRTTSEKIQSILLGLSRTVPVFAVIAVVLSTVSAVSEGTSASINSLFEYVVRIVLFVLSSFMGNYVPVPGQPAEPTLLSAIALTFALATSLGGVTLAVLRVFTRDLAIAVTLLRRNRVVVFGDTQQAKAVARRARALGKPVIEIGRDVHTGIRVESWVDVHANPRVTRALKRAVETYVMDPSSVENALIAERINAPNTRVFQLFDWESDRLVFRQPIVSGMLPTRESFSPAELVGVHLVQLIAQVVRMHKDVIRVHFDGDAIPLEVAQERLEFMHSVLSFRGSVEVVSEAHLADIVVIGLSQHRQVTHMDKLAGGQQMIIVLAPTRTFAALGRDDLKAVGSREWLNEHRGNDELVWRRRVVVVDEELIGYDMNEISLGLLDRWAREFHNAHSDYRPSGDANRWLTNAPHSRLVAMARSAVMLMLEELHRHGYGLTASEEAHAVLPNNVVNSCAQKIHEQYLTLTWRHHDGTERHCADYFVDASGALQDATAPPAWDDDSEENHERNRQMVSAVYPALASVFGYRITKLGAEGRGTNSV